MPAESRSPHARRVLVIGSGPAGMVTTAQLRARGLAVRHVDRQAEIGGAYARMWPGIRLSSPARLIGLPGLSLEPSAAHIDAAEYHAYLQDYARVHGIAPERALVRRIEALEPGFRVHLESPARAGPPTGAGVVQSAEFDQIVVATGMFDHPIWPAISGLSQPDGTQPHTRAPDSPRLMHAAEFRGVDGLAGRTVLIIGGASSAVEIAEQCARAGARVLVSARAQKIRVAPEKLLGRELVELTSPWLRRLPRWSVRAPCERGFTAPGVDLGFARLRAQGAIEVRPEVTHLRGRRASFAHGSASTADIDVDIIIAATGYGHAMPFLPDDIARTAAGHARTRACQSVSHPGLFFVGLPCARSLASQYLYGIAGDAVFLARALSTVPRK